MSNSHDWNQPPRARPSWWGPGQAAGVPDGQMRVSDLERQDVTNTLCRHYGDGRLDEAEFNARMERATAAKTRDDLAPLLLDLPPLGTPATTGSAPAVRRRGVPLVLVIVAAVLIAASLLPFTFAAWHVHWFIIIVIIAFIALRGRGRRSRHDNWFHA
jgi:Domain of unknown function (DUF1707)